MTHVTPDPVSLHDRFDTVTRPVVVDGDEYHLVSVRDTNVLFDTLDPAAFAADERIPYWADLWPSSVEMARILRNADLHGKQVLELGSGLGLAGLAAARAGGHVRMTDYEEDALLFAAENVRMNLNPGECSRVTLAHLDWRSPELKCRFDLILGADIVYERRFFAPLADLFSTLLRPEGVVLLTDPGRTIAKEFFEHHLATGWECRRHSAQQLWQGANLTITTHIVYRTGADISWPGRGVFEGES